MDREESLFLTVSEDHRKREYPEYVRAMIAPFRGAGGMAGVYEGVILGGGDKLFGLGELNLWLRRHRYAAYDMDILLPIAHMCLEYAVRRRLAAQRPGIPAMAEQAARELLDADPLRWRYTARNWMYIYWLTRQFPRAATAESRDILKNFAGFQDMLRLFTRLTQESGGCADARSLVDQSVLLYKKIFTRYFAPDHSQDILPNPEYGAGELWDEEDPLAEGAEPEEFQSELNYEKTDLTASDGLLMSEEALAAVPEYLAKNFGPSFQTEQAMREIERTVCTGIHEGRRLLFTDGLPDSAYEEDSPRAGALKASRDANLRMLEENMDSARQGIRSIEQAFRNALNLKNDPEFYRSDHGVLVNSTLWKAGRCEDPRLFRKIFHQDQSTVVVELLIDASGSQISRQSMVALQSYMFSAALSRIQIPHRVMSYCTYGDHTVLRRFRDYDDKPEADRKILEYRATSNNRDGLALAAAGVGLLKRREDHKIVIVFSDGLPNDMVSGRNHPVEKYIGDAAIRDTCFHIRKLRRKGIHVIGVFLGSDSELENERIIYGASFLRIRQAGDFGGAAGKRLSETLLLL
ncbi:MAG: hypothetical protein HFF42_03730 [Lawsonibacter sp.]|jgi:hypothetical protein|nr:hypothetical protein [Lawsonibacter sp.]